jgi:hypothetical protein
MAPKPTSDRTPRSAETTGTRYSGDSICASPDCVHAVALFRDALERCTVCGASEKDGRPFMPIEFAVAAYRFAHSIIRPAYIINAATANGIAIFGPDGGFNLNGGRPIPSDLVIVRNNILRIEPGTGRPPRKIDTNCRCRSQRLGPVGGRIVAEILVGPCSGTRTRTYTSTQAGNPPRRSHPPPVSSRSPTC